MDQELRKIIKENSELTREIHDMTKYIKRFVIFQQIFGVLKFLIIIIPLILGIIYLPSLLRDTLDEYQGILQLGGSALQLQGSDVDQGSIDLDLEDIPPELLESLQEQYQ